MIIETKNSTYEIQGNTIRKIAGVVKTGSYHTKVNKHFNVEDEFVVFEGYLTEPKVGKKLVLALGGGNIISTSTIVAIDGGANENGR